MAVATGSTFSIDLVGNERSVERSSPTHIPELNQLSNEFARIVDSRFLSGQISEEQQQVLNIAKGVLRNYPGVVSELPLAIQCETARTDLPSYVHFFGVNENFVLRCGVMALYSWAFSIADARVEKAMTDSHLGGRKLRREDILPTALNAKVSDVYTPGKRGERPVLVGELLETVIPSLEEIFKIPDSIDRKKLVVSIVRHQLHGLSLIEKFVQRGKPYSVQEAIAYMHGTVIDYGKLLASVLYTDEEKQKRFVKEVAIHNLHDDKVDFLADLFSQPNVYLAVAFQHTNLADLAVMCGKIFKQVRGTTGIPYGERITKKIGDIFLAVSPQLNQAFASVPVQLLKDLQ